MNDDDWYRLLEAADKAEDDVIAEPDAPASEVASAESSAASEAAAAEVVAPAGTQDGEDPMPLTRSHLGKLRVWWHRTAYEFMGRILLLWLMPGSGALALYVVPWDRLKESTAWWILLIGYGGLAVIFGAILWCVALFDDSFSMRDERDRRLFEENTEIAVATDRWLGEHQRNVERIATARAIRRIALEVRQKQLEEGIRYHHKLLPSSRRLAGVTQAIASWDARDNPPKLPKRSPTFTAR